MPSIDFACRIVPMDQLLRCSFGLNPTEMQLLKMLASRKPDESDITELSTELGKDRTTLQRSLNNLHKKSLIVKRQINLDKGGYFYVYSSISKKEIKERIYKNFDTYKKAVEEAIEKW